jgi:hypothetical protein
MTVYLNWYGKKKFLSFIETKEKREKKKKQNDKNLFFAIILRINTSQISRIVVMFGTKTFMFLLFLSFCFLFLL